MAGIIPNGVGSQQSGEIPRRSSEPTQSELPVDEDTGTVRGLIYLDVSVSIVKVTIPDGSGGVATGTVVDLSALTTL